MYLYYISFFKNQGWTAQKINCYLHTRNLDNKCIPEITEDTELNYYTVYFMNYETSKQKLNDNNLFTLKYAIDDAMYNFFKLKKI